MPGAQSGGRISTLNHLTSAEHGRLVLAPSLCGLSCSKLSSSAAASSCAVSSLNVDFTNSQSLVFTGHPDCWIQSTFLCCPPVYCISLSPSFSFSLQIYPRAWVPPTLFCLQIWPKTFGSFHSQSQKRQVLSNQVTCFSESGVLSVSDILYSSSPRPLLFSVCPGIIANLFAFVIMLLICQLHE